MTTQHFDVIVIGARCAGSPTAMLLARQGCRVLVVDRATFPSDTVSTHLVHPPAVAALRRWGLLERLLATGCPPIHTYCFDFGPFAIEGEPGTADSPVAYAPRRTVLDKLLVDAAREAGAEVREGFAVDEVVRDGARVIGIRGRGQDGSAVTALAPLVIGADGHQSIVARAVAPERYHERPPLLCGYYAYWSGVDMAGRFETYILDRRGIAAFPTHDRQAVVIAGWPYAEFEANRHDLEASYHGVFELAPAFAARLRAGRRDSRIAGMPVPNHFRRPFGDGWALVGDAGCIKDPITAQGINDAFHDAELLAGAIERWRSGGAELADALADYQTARDTRILPMFEFTCGLATLEPPPPEMQQLLGAVHGNRAAMDAFCQVNAGVVSPAVFFSPDNVGRIMAQRAPAPAPAP